MNAVLARHPAAQPSAQPTVIAPPLFEIRGLQVAYDRRVVLDNVNLNLARRRVTALIGPSGCGKTTFLHCLNRLTDMVPRCRVAGELKLDGLDLTSPQIDLISLRRRVGMIFQKPNPFPLSILRNLELPLKEHGVRDRRQRRQLIETALRDVGLWDEVHQRLDASALALSGGQQQRLCLARALVLQPEILLMDEPTSALDPLAAAKVEELIHTLRQRFTVIIVTHNLAQARRLADDVAVFWVRDGRGCMIESGSVEQVFKNPQDPDTEAYLRGLQG